MKIPVYLFISNYTNIKKVRHTMTKQILLGVCLALIWMSACKSTTYTPKNFEGRKILFAKGGGITGQYETYLLLENGQLFNQAKIDGEWAAFDNIKKGVAKRLFKKLDEMSWTSLKVSQPGNITYFIELQDQESAHRVTWGSESSEVNAELRALHYELMNMAQSAQPEPSSSDS